MGRSGCWREMDRGGEVGVYVVCFGIEKFSLFGDWKYSDGEDG